MTQKLMRSICPTDGWNKKRVCVWLAAKVIEQAAHGEYDDSSNKLILNKFLNRCV